MLEGVNKTAWGLSIAGGACAIAGAYLLNSHVDLSRALVAAALWFGQAAAFWAKK